MLQVDIVSPEVGNVFHGEVASIYLPGSEGEMGILPMHCDTLTMLRSGVIELDFEDGSNALVAISWGEAKISSSRVDILVNDAKLVDGKSEPIAKAIKEAAELLERASTDKLIISPAIMKLNSYKG